MKKPIFLAHDPGGYDVIFPVVQNLQHAGIAADFYCTGPSANLNALHAMGESQVIQAIQSALGNRKVSGLITGSSWGNSLELRAIALCQQAGIPTISILDYWSNYQSRFIRYSEEPVYPDYYIMMDKLAKKEAIQSGVPPEIIRILGHPGLDKYIDYPRQVPCSDKNQKKILFLSQPLSVLYGESLGYTEQRAFADCRLLLGTQDNCILQVKFHPKDETSFRLRYADMAVEGDLMDIIPEYDLVIGMNTMGLLHTVLIGVPAISYQPNLQAPDQCITNKLGLTRLVGSYQDLKRLLATKVDKQVINTRSLAQRLIWLDGRSTERVAGFIRGVLSNEV